MSINRWMDKEDVVHIYNGILLLSHKKEWNNAIFSNMDRPRDYHTKWSKSDRARQISYDITYIWNLKIWYRDFPGGPVVKNPPSHAGEAGSIPCRRTKIPHAAGQLNPRAATTELAYSGACVPQLESPRASTTEPVRSGAHTPQLLSPHATTREKPTRHKEKPIHRNKRSCMPQRRSRVPQLRPNAAK